MTLLTVHTHGSFLSAASLGDETASTMTQYPTQSHYPNTKLTCACPIVVMPQTPGQIVSNINVACSRFSNSRPFTREAFALTNLPPNLVLGQLSNDFPSTARQTVMADVVNKMRYYILTACLSSLRHQSTASQNIYIYIYPHSGALYGTPLWEWVPPTLTHKQHGRDVSSIRE